jgi:hypothetical protein
VRKRHSRSRGATHVSMGMHAVGAASASAGEGRRRPTRDLGEECVRPLAAVRREGLECASAARTRRRPDESVASAACAVGERRRPLAPTCDPEINGSSGSGRRLDHQNDAGCVGGRGPGGRRRIVR